MCIVYRTKSGEVGLGEAVGLGSKLSEAIHWMDFLDKHRIFKYCTAIQIHFEGGEYFRDLFALNTMCNTVCKMKRQEQLVNVESIFPNQVSLKRASYLIDKYLIPNAEVQAKVDTFYNEHFKGRKVMGVHYRGSDKNIKEATRISYDKVLRNIMFYQQKFSLDTIFLMSDEGKFIEYMGNTSLKASLVCHPDSTYFDGGSWHTAHKSDEKSFLQHALMETLLLSKCDFIIKTTSALSAFSKMINPDIPTCFLFEGGMQRYLAYHKEILETSLPPV